jgi:MFS family permease
MGAIMFPQTLSVIQVTFPPRERGTAFGMFGATIGLATITGPLVGGLLINGDVFGLEWRPIFLVNVPIGVIALVAAARLLQESRAPDAIRPDLVGVGIVSAGLLLLVYPLVQGRELDWPPWTFLAMAAAVPVLAVFAAWERRKKAADGSPLVDLGLFRQRAFVAGLLVAGIFFMGIPAFFLTFTLWLQIGLGFTALHAGLTAIPFAVGSALASTASVRLAPRLGRRILSLGTLLITIGMAGVIATVDRYGGATHSWQLIPALAVCGLGLGSVIAPLVNVVLAGIRGQDAGSASGVLTTVQQVGGAVGVALIGVIFFGLLGSHAGAVGADLAPGLEHSLESSGVPAAVSRQVVAGFETCFEDRSAAKDPSAVPASCQRAQAQSGSQPQVGRVVAATADSARRQNFSDVLQRTLLFEVAVFLTCFLLVFLLSPDDGGLRPPGRPRRRSRPGRRARGSAFGACGLGVHGLRTAGLRAVGAQHPEGVGGQVGGDRAALLPGQRLAAVLHHRLDRLAVGEADDQLRDRAEVDEPLDHGGHAVGAAAAVRFEPHPLRAVALGVLVYRRLTRGERGTSAVADFASQL